MEERGGKECMGSQGLGGCLEKEEWAMELTLLMRKSNNKLNYQLDELEWAIVSWVDLQRGSCLMAPFQSLVRKRMRMLLSRLS